ncbi:MAG: hypothetical protein ACRD0H_22215 [Actinomycetes bacterium]
MLAMAQAVATCVIGAGSVWWARKAAGNTRAISNGFASHVLTTLDDIVRRLERLEDK